MICTAANGVCIVSATSALASENRQLSAVLRHGQAGLGRRQQGRRPGVAELEGRGGVGVHEGLLDRRLVGRPVGDDDADPVEQGEVAAGRGTAQALRGSQGGQGEAGGPSDATTIRPLQCNR